jgi:hypothetical protein
MKKKTNRHGMRPLLALAAGVLLLGPAAPQADIVMNPKVIGASVDFGEVKEGVTDDLVLTRTGVFVSASGVVDEKLEVRLTLGGLFWYAATEQADAVNRLVKYGSGVGEAQGIYTFGSPSDPHSRLQFGVFNVKYSDAHNLGEYLYRSGTYPGYMVTGGWSYLNAAGYQAQGLRYVLPTFSGKVTHDFSLYMERGWEPMHDISPGYNLTVRPTPAVEVGAGVVWAHGIPLKSDKYLTPKAKRNAYSKTTGMPVDGADAPRTPENPFGIEDSVIFNIPGDPSSGVNTILYDTSAREAQTLRDWAACQAGDCSNIGYYTFKGFKAALRASLDIGMLLANPMMKPGDFKVYTEAALLGFKDYPYYYEDKLARLPVMAGINIPTFGWLSRLSAEAEYRKDRFRNTIYAVNRTQNPTPVTGAGAGGGNAYAYENGGPNTDDDWKWSFYASRNITQGINLTAQVASDHERHPDFWGVFSDEPVTIKSSDWYYVVRVDFSL